MTSKFNSNLNNSSFDQFIDLFSHLSIANSSSSSSSSSTSSTTQTEEKKSSSQEKKITKTQEGSILGRVISTKPANIYTEEQIALLQSLPQELSSTITFTNKKLCDVIYYTAVHRILNDFPTDVVWNILGGTSSAPDSAFYWMHQSNAEEILTDILRRQANQAIQSVNGLIRQLPDITRQALIHPLFASQLQSFCFTANELLQDENPLRSFSRLNDVTLTNLTEQDASSSATLFQRLADLETVQNLSLHSFAPHALDNLSKVSSLQSLVLSPRNRVGVGYNLPRSFSELQNLRHLELHHYLFGSGNARLSMSSIKTIPNLRSITMTKCIGAHLAYLFHEHPTLERICLIDQVISSDCLKALKTCPHLQEVVFVNCHFESMSSTTTADLTTLLQKELPKAQVLVSESNEVWETKTIKELALSTR